jgi:hypothetical protein
MALFLKFLTIGGCILGAESQSKPQSQFKDSLVSAFGRNLKNAVPACSIGEEYFVRGLAPQYAKLRINGRNGQDYAQTRYRLWASRWLNTTYVITSRTTGSVGLNARYKLGKNNFREDVLFEATQSKIPTSITLVPEGCGENPKPWLICEKTVICDTNWASNLKKKKAEEGVKQKQRRFEEKTKKNIQTISHHNDTACNEGVTYQYTTSDMKGLGYLKLNGKKLRITCGLLKM